MVKIRGIKKETSLEWLINKKLAFIGDSITADKKSNYVTLTIDEIAKQIDASCLNILNFGVDSYSINNALDMTPEIVTEENPDIFVIFIGVNDSKIFRHLARPLVSPNMFRENYAALLNRIDAAEGRHYKVLVTLPALMFEEIKYGDLLAEYWYWEPSLYLEYINIIRELGSQKDCAIADIYEGFKFALSNGARLFYEDGVHPNIYGHRIIADEVIKALSRLAI